MVSVLLTVSVTACKPPMASEYTVTYAGNGSESGTVPVDSTTYSVGQTVSVLGNTGGLAKSGDFFGGWNTKADGSGTAYSVGDTFTIGAGDVTLYARWTQGYRVYYNGNGGTKGSAPTDSHLYRPGETTTVLGNSGNLAEIDNDFNGWNTKKDGTGTEYTAGSTFSIDAADVTLYAQWKAKSWKIVGTADFNVGDTTTYGLSLAIDSAGTPYVAYEDPSGGSHKGTVDNFVDGSWQNVGQPLFTTGAVGGQIDLAIDSSGTPYVAYRDNSQQDYVTSMKYTATGASGWLLYGSAGFSQTPVTSLSLATDTSGTPYVAFDDPGHGGGATATEYNGTDWGDVGSQSFTPAGVKHPSLALDSSGTPYLAFVDENEPNENATVMRFNGTKWGYVGSEGFSAGTAYYIDLAINPNNIPYVVYQDGGNSKKATVMRFSGGAWQSVGSPGFTQGKVQSPQIAFGQDGTPYIAFEDGPNGNTARVMRYTGAGTSGWVTVGAASISPGVASSLSFAIDPSGTPYVAYEDTTNSGKVTVMSYR